MNTNEGVQGAQDAIRYSPNEAVLLLQDWFGQTARAMSRSNRSLVDDLVQEMSLGVLRCGGKHTCGFFKKRACLRARNFLRGEWRQRIRVERYGRLRHRTDYDPSTFIEDLVDLENKLNSRTDEPIVEPLYLDMRASA